jgi:group I intron endonuclease
MKADPNRNAKVYLITCLVNGKEYVGKTIRPLHRRWRLHVYASRSGTAEAGTRLHKAIKKYGEDAFQISLLEEFSSEVEAYAAEKLWIKNKNTIVDGYNTAEGGHGFTSESATKMSMEPAVRQARSLRMKKQAREMWQNQEIRTQVLQHMNDPKRKEMQRAITSNLWKDPSHRRRVTEALHRRNENPDYRAKMKAHTNRLWTDEVYRQRHQRRVRCLETNVIFNSVRDAAEAFGISGGNMSNLLAGRWKKGIPGYHFEYVTELGES